MDREEILARRLERERRARKEAEALLEEKSLALFHSNEALRRSRDDLEARVLERTAELEAVNERLRLENAHRRATEDALRLAKELAETSARAKAQFLATMSHEIRTPMNAIIGLSGLLLESPLDEEAREFAQIIRSSGEALLGIVNDILDYSRIEAGGLTLEHVPFDVREEVAVAMDIMRALATEKGLVLSSEIAPDVPGTAAGDAGRIRQVLLNLVGNAVKFTERGAVNVRVTHVSDGEGDGGDLCFDVTDTGIGIPRSIGARLFDSFAQVDASTTRRFGGTGLGLAIAKQLAELHGGSIGFESEEGRGSRFWFTVHVTRVSCETTGAPGTTFSDTARSAETSPTVETDGGRVTPRRDGARPGVRGIVLVADDNTVNQRVAGSLLARLGFRADFAANGIEALDAVRRIAYDAVLMDCQMPEMDGFEATRALRALPCAAARVPVIALTANAMQGDRERCLACGMDDYLAKPIRLADLRAVLDRWLGARAA